MSSKASGFRKHEKNESEEVDREFFQFQTNVKVPGHYFDGQEAQLGKNARESNPSVQYLTCLVYAGSARNWEDSHSYNFD